jgi:hypothetical protein
MADHDLKRSFRSRDGVPFIVFLILSVALDGLGAYKPTQGVPASCG